MTAKKPLARKPGDVPAADPATYVHPKALGSRHAKRFASACITDDQSFALVKNPGEEKWWVWAPMSDKEHVEGLIDQSSKILD